MLTLLGSLAVAAPPVEVRTVDHAGRRFHVATLDLHAVELDLRGQEAGGPHRFADLTDDDALLVATNAGMFHAPDDPVGLWIQGGEQRAPLEDGRGLGNFFLKPNGVFWVDGSGAHVADARDWTRSPSTRAATQSGPALVLDGALHPAFDPESPNLRLRSGVGVSDPWTVHLVVSEGEVRFHELATLFRDVLGCDDALYLDGTISGLWTPELPSPARYDYAGFVVATPRAPATGLQDGDLVFQRSSSRQAAAIAAATGSDWTHMGLIRRVGGEPFVLEAVQPVRLTPWAAWVARAVDGRVAVRRLAEAEAVWTPEALARLDALQATWLGRPYDLQFGWGDDALYCSELVHKAVHYAAGIELTELRPIGSYAVHDPDLRAAMEARWGAVPEDLRVVAPPDLFEAPGLVDVTP